MGAFAFWFRATFAAGPVAGMDELAQLSISHQPSLFEVLQRLSQPGPHQFPLDFALTWITSFFTTDIALLRWLPALWGSLSVIFIYRIGEKLEGPLLGGCAAWALSISSFHIEYSQILRPYALAVFLLLLSLHFFLKALDNHKAFFSYGLSLALFQLTYPFALCKTIVDLFFLRKWKPIGKLRLMMMTLPALVIPLIWVIYNHRMFGQSRPFSFPLDTLIGYPQLRNAALTLNQNNSWILGLYTLLFLVGIIRLMKHHIIKEKGYLLSLLIIFLIIPFAALIKAKLPIYPKYFIPVFPIYLLMVAMGVVEIYHVLRRIATSTLLASVLIILFSFSSMMAGLSSYRELFINRTSTKLNLLRMSNYIRNNAQDGDDIILSNPNFGATLLYYLDRPAFFQIQEIQLLNGFAFFMFGSAIPITVRNNKLNVFTLCVVRPEIATIDRDIFVSRKSHHVWLVNSSINYFQEENPFFTSFGISGEQVSEPTKGVYVYDRELNSGTRIRT